ncbi:MAG: hypothetical protein II922_07710 [Succinimonas sp.]|nr:hypothetical protein [Succinimonas sp.]
MNTKKSDELKLAAIKAKCSLNEELDEFIQKIDKATEDPDNFITMTQLEQEWNRLSLKTHKIYSNMVSEALTAIDTKELISAKKENSSRKESA